MNDEFIIGKLYQAFLNNCPSNINKRGIKYSISCYQLIESIFLCS